MVDIARVENLSDSEIQGLNSLRIPLGTDALQVMKTKCEQTLEHMSVWEGFAGSTEYKGAEAVSSYLK